MLNTEASQGHHKSLLVREATAQENKYRIGFPLNVNNVKQNTQENYLFNSVCVWVYIYITVKRKKTNSLYKAAEQAVKNYRYGALFTWRPVNSSCQTVLASTAHSPAFFRGWWHWNTLFTEQLQKIRAKYDNVETVGFSQLLLAAIALERYNQALHYLGLQNCYPWKLEVGLHGNIRSTLSIFMASVSASCRWISTSWLHTLLLCNGPKGRH